MGVLNSPTMMGAFRRTPWICCWCGPAMGIHGDSSKPVHQGSQWQKQRESQPGPSGFQYVYQPSDETRQRERLQRQERSGSKSAGKWKPKFSTSTLRGRPSMEVRSHQPIPTLAWTKTEVELKFAH